MKNKAVVLIYLAVISSILTEFKIEAKPVNINAPNILLLSGVFLTIYDYLKNKKIDKKFLKIFSVSIFFVAFSATSFRIEVGNSYEHLRTVVTLSKGMVVILLINYWIYNYYELKKVSRGLVWAGVVAAVGAFIQGYFWVGADNIFFGERLRGTDRLSYFGLNLGIQRAAGFLEGYGLLGVYTESAALLSAIGFLSHGRRQGWTRSLASLGVVVGLTGLLVSQSRSGLLAIVVGYIVFYTLATLVYSRLSIVRMAPIALIIGVLVYFGPELSETLVAVNEKAVTNRIEGYWAAAMATVSNPIFGIGFSNTFSKLDYYSTVHNSYLSLISSAGVVAFALYAYLKVKAIREGMLCLKASDSRAPIAIGLLSALSAAIVECLLFGGGVFTTAVFVIIGLLIALGRVADKHPANT